ncbi:hypothetical protein [Fredinandcohnia quinoae]|uniref:Uncharacterized protein n=1 Tax=Fredinandcohnia quinoae TaxID=2918902 RepID=A0AAW5E241_9BACI|nr:hypothetical protein [Fredinandcohnia sp. SECRCQ15]MCH1624066.1 hypothetical protein [Fredinandcohnia sp. SECRCQ15]
MILLVCSIILFNFLLYKTVKGISVNKIVHLWTFTIAFQLFFDVFIDLKYKGYWYFTQGVDWVGTPAYIMLIPPVNIMFVNWYPFEKTIIIKIGYFLIWEIFLLGYETLALSPHPFGYFHYGWWNVWHSAVVNPVLLIIVLTYYKWICKLEVKACKAKIE